MARWLVLSLLFVSACSAAPQSDLQYIKQGRSLAAEWALVNEQAGKGRLSATYVAAMHGWLRDGLQTAAASLSEPDSGYGREMKALLAEPADASPDELRAHSRRLKQIEDQLESA